MAERKTARKRLSLFFWACVITVIVAAVMGITVFVLYFFGVTRPSTSMILVGLAMVMAVAGTVIAAVMSRVLLRPVEQLSEASKRIAKGDFHPRLEYNGSIREIRDTYDSFNTMARELSAIETLREDFIANVSHEFKTPLTAIEGYSMLLQDESLSESERQECIQKIVAAVSRLSTLVSNILLLSNAVKFSPEGGTLGLKMREDGKTVTVTVSDEGPGMSPEVQRHMFDKFYQGDGSRRQEGSGLGLALVWRILQLLGGEISVESGEGKGSAFTVALPVI